MSHGKIPQELHFLIPHVEKWSFDSLDGRFTYDASKDADKTAALEQLPPCGLGCCSKHRTRSPQDKTYAEAHPEHKVIKGIGWDKHAGRAPRRQGPGRSGF